ncbi:MAG: mannose-1-phosphate guanylyltransferase/mannose-6-phosphate isomerase [Nitrospirae bacterium]|nr:mannose-1-phosphate guanylyltransferase/mannose-6-phosphate isomerase [Nitrospirota bacterium]
MLITPVILSGGSGTRLWPLSRELYPKQLLPLVGTHTMLQNTVARLRGIDGAGAPLIVANDSHRFMVAEQMRLIGVKPEAIMLEPVGRNTAPAVAVAALHASAKRKDPVLLVLPADHVIKDAASFHAAVAAGEQLAKQGRLITFGIVPTGPETGYGYIKKGKKLGAKGIGHAVERFVEKPDLATAAKYVSSGDYLWNSGMFMFRASSFLKELKRFAPAMLAACIRAYKASARDLDFLRLGEEAFAASPGDSIDYAVMEKTAAAAVIPLDAGWSDVGSWASLWEVHPRDRSGNAIAGDVIAKDMKNSLIHAGSRLVAAIGLKDVVVVETADAVLVAHKDHSQKVKQVVDELKGSRRDEALLHRRVNRPWGAYECIDSEERFQVKRITVNPGASLSLQKHMHRAEHWVVVKGTARITRGKEVVTLSENESTYIPLGVKHRLENPGKILLELIEVQSGSYLGEDDIVRFDDRYGRHGAAGAGRSRLKTKKR